MTGEFSHRMLLYQSNKNCYLGPFSINGTPLRRVAQAYVIATKTKVDIDAVNIPENLTDDYFRRSKPEKKKKDGDIFSDSKKASKHKLAQSCE